MTEEMNDSAGNDDDDKNDPEDNNTGENASHSSHPFRRRRKIKVRKRVRVKKKSSPKKRAQKVLETIIWISVLTIFIVTLIIFFKEMDINSAKSPSKKTSELLYPSEGNINSASITFYNSGFINKSLQKQKIVL